MLQYLRVFYILRVLRLHREDWSLKFRVRTAYQVDSPLNILLKVRISINFIVSD